MEQNIPSIAFMQKFIINIFIHLREPAPQKNQYLTSKKLYHLLYLDNCHTGIPSSFGNI